MNKPSSNFDEQIERFEQVWNDGDVPNIRDFLIPTNSDRKQVPDSEVRLLLDELVKIDLEYRWRRDSTSSGGLQRIVEDYLDYLETDKNQVSIPLDWIAEEYRIRRRWGDNPTPLSYAERFADRTSDVEAALLQVDQELALRQSFVEKRRLNESNEAESAGLAPANRHTLEVGNQIDDFRLLNELGRGAFARVFLAQQVSMQRLVALKVSDQKSMESPVLCQLEHANIVRVFDERVIGSMYLMYMQYVAGGSLRDVLDHLGQVPTEERTEKHFADAIQELLRRKGESIPQNAAWVAQGQLHWPSVVARLGARIADALAHAHQLGVVHRDLKPENVLLTNTGEPMLADFNLSFAINVKDASPEKSFGGSLAYMSPEHLQVLNGTGVVEDVDELSDVYSLGALLFEALENRRPFELSAAVPAPWTISDHLKVRQQFPGFSVSCRKQGVNSDPESHQMRPENSSVDNLNRLISSCLSWNKKERPRSAEEVARQLQIFSIKSLQKIFNPSVDGWISKFARTPGFWFLTFGLIPNAILSPLNIWANRRISIQYFDNDFFWNIEMPVVNLVGFSTGIVVAWLLVKPIAQGFSMLRNGMAIPDSMRRHLALRSLKSPIFIAVVVLFLWAASGVVFPGWNYWATGRPIDSMEYLGFFLSQLIHGVIASCLSFILSSHLVLNAIYPKLYSRVPSSVEMEQLARVDRQLGWADACLGMTPMFALLAIALSNLIDKPVFVALAVVGFASHFAASHFIPRLRATIKSLQLALAPTATLLSHREPTH